LNRKKENLDARKMSADVIQYFETVKLQNIESDEAYKNLVKITSKLDNNEKSQVMKLMNKLQYDEKIRKVVYKLSEHLFNILKEYE
tara:strand:- start:1873 stop:2130 length:258 start_codon:yes stop_codon:yes gene_type:complete